MAFRCACGNGIRKARARLGYTTCLKCGEQAAQTEIDAKKRRVAICANKSNYVYLTPGQKLTDIGRK